MKKKGGGQKWSVFLKNLVCTPNLKELLSKQYLLLDTSVIIDASKCNEVRDALLDIKEAGCILLSLPAVKEEFLCPANSRFDYDRLMDFVKSLDVSFPDGMDKHLLDDGKDFSIALSQCRIKPSHVDRLLLFTPYFYRNAMEKVYLATSNHKDVPERYFDRVGFITHDIGGFHNIGIYELNEAGMNIG